MKTFTQFSSIINEGFVPAVTSDVNPGNNVALGVANHYTPVENIVSNVRNLFATVLGCVAAVGEDGVSVKLHSTKFVTKEEISKLLYQPVFNHLCLNDYIMQQGLDFVKMINLGQYWVVYYCPRDIPQVTNTCTCVPGFDCACKEQYDFEAEMDSFITESDDDEEMEDATHKKVLEIITSKDKVKAAKQLELIVGQQIELPREYYFAGVKSKVGEESIALRWKYTKRASRKTTTEITKSIINIFGTGDDAIFVSDFDKDTMFKLPPEVKKLIQNIIELLGGKKTNDPCVFSIKDTDSEKDEDDSKPKDEEDDSSSEENEETSTTSNKPTSKQEDDDDTRGDKSDDILGLG